MTGGCEFYWLNSRLIAADCGLRGYLLPDAIEARIPGVASLSADLIGSIQTAYRRKARAFSLLKFERMRDREIGFYRHAHIPLVDNFTGKVW
jgi:hypothetical protein